MTPEEPAAVTRTVLEEAPAEDSLALPAAKVPDPRVERPRNHDHGDWSTSVVMQLTRKAGTKPRDPAEFLAPCLEALDDVAPMEVADPGFPNARLDAVSAGEPTRFVIKAGEAHGRNGSLSGQHISLEYVSANPTGPVHLGGARWAAVGDSLARILPAYGAQVTREYYFSDRDIQIDCSARSLLASVRGQKTPEDGYGGVYINKIAQQVTADKLAAGRPDPATLSDTEATEVFCSRGADLIFAAVKAEPRAFRSDLNVFFHEDSLHTSDTVERAITRLRKYGTIEKHGGATWLRTTDFGDDKGRVLIKSNGNAAYFAADLAYHLDKRERGADCTIYLFGVSHHDYIGRMMAMCAAFRDTPGTDMQVFIGQLVNLVYNGVSARMSRCTGTIITLEDLVNTADVDAACYTLARSSIDSVIDTDLGLLASSTSGDPVYCVQYAHAHTRNVVRNVAEYGASRDPNKAPFGPGALDDPVDTTLPGVLIQLPTTMAQVAQLCEQHRMARYLEQPAAAYHAWYDATRVTPRGGDVVDSGYVARLWFNDAVGQVLANGSGPLGVSAPERM